MSTLTTTISLSSTTLFPTPVHVIKTVTESVNGSHSGFETATIGSSQSSILSETYESTGDSGIVYFYANASSSNTTTIDLILNNHTQDVNVYIARLNPGEVLYMPLWAVDNNGYTITAENAAGASAVLSYFIGSKD